MCSSSTTAGLTECRASRWVAEPERLGELMARIDCRGGHTQIGKVLAHARRENDTQQGRRRWSSSATPWRRRLDDLCAAAGELGLRGVSGFHVPGRLRSGLPSRRFARSRG